MVSDDIPDHILRRPGMDRILNTLATRRRRVILLLLKQGRLDTTADILFRGEIEADDAEIALTHNHLPRLEDAGYIEWDQETGEIAKGPRFEEIEPFLDLIENHADELPPGWS